MEAVQKDNWYSLALLTFLIFLKASLQDRGETVTLADGMVLDCMCPWNGNLSMVSWTKVPDKTALAIFHPSYGTTFGDGYDERLMFLRKSTMDGSISFGNVTEQDAGLYRCSMQTFPLGTWTRDVRVIKESHSPYVELDFSEGENLTIVCPHHNYSVMHALIKKDENETVGRCTMQAGALVAEDLHEGIQMNCADPILGVTFDLNNVAESDQGLYQCLLTTEDGVEITNYLLTVRHEDASYTHHPEEAAVYPILTHAQVLEDPDPAEATDITEAPHSDTEDSEPSSSAPTGRMLTTDSVSSDTTNSLHHPSAPNEGDPTEVAPAIATSLPHPPASTEGIATTEVAPSVVETSVSHPQAPIEEVSTHDTIPPVVVTTGVHHPDPSEKEDSTEMAPAVIATTALHLPEECSIPVEVGPCRGEFPRFYYNTTSHSCEGFAFGGCRGNVNNFLYREECESTCGVGTGATEAMSTTESTHSVVATTDSQPTDPLPSVEISTPDSVTSVIVSTEHPAPSEEMATTEPAPSLVDTTVLPSKAPPEEEPTHAYALPPVPATTLLPPPVPEPSEGDASDPTTSPQSTTWWPDWLPDWISTDTFWSVWEWAKEIHQQYWIYIYAGAAGVALLLVVLIVVLVIVCRRRRRRRRVRVRTHPGKRWRDSEMGGFYDRLRRGTRFGRQEPVYANVRTGPKSKHKPKTKRRR